MMSVKVTSTRLGKVKIRTSVFVHYSLVDTAHVANTATFSFFSQDVQSDIAFPLNAADTLNLIAALKLHHSAIEQAEIELAKFQPQAA
jgi:hypothetical protein